MPRTSRSSSRTFPRRLRVLAPVAVLALVAGVLQFLPSAGADEVTIKQVSSSEDSGVIDLNRDGAADYVRYGVTNEALSVGEQPSDGSDLRLIIPFRASTAALDAVQGGGSANVAMKVWRVDNLGARKVVVDAYSNTGRLTRADYRRAAAPVATLVPVEGRVALDVTKQLKSMSKPGTFTLRLRLDQPAPKTRGPLTQVNIAMSEAHNTVNRPVLSVSSTTSARPAATVTTVPAPTTTSTPTAVSTTTSTSKPPATAPEPAPTPDAGAPPAAVTGGAAWDVMFDDEFSDPAATAAKWSNGMRSGAKTLGGNGELQWYQPANSVVDGGVLTQTIKKESVPGTTYPANVLSELGQSARAGMPYQFTSGMLNNAKSFGYRYGYVEARVKMPKGFGFWPALWMRDWQPWSYEIDVMEGFDANARTLRSSYWWGNEQHTGMDIAAGGDIGLLSSGGLCHAYAPAPATTSATGKCSVANSMDLSAGYHTIGLNWTPTKYEFYFDGQKSFESPAGADVDRAYNHLILNLAFGNTAWEFDWNKEGIDPFSVNLTDGVRFFKPSIEWDYVRVWQAPGQHDVCTSGSCPG